MIFIVYNVLPVVGTSEYAAAAASLHRHRHVVPKAATRQQ